MKSGHLTILFSFIKKEDRKAQEKVKEEAAKRLRELPPKGSKSRLKETIDAGGTISKALIIKDIKDKEKRLQMFKTPKLLQRKHARGCTTSKLLHTLMQQARSATRQRPTP